MATSVQIGDSQPVARHGTVSALAISSVSVADLEDATSFINSSLEGGKKANAMIVVEGSTIAIAQGPAATDAWHLVSDGGAVPVVPA